MRSLSRKTKIFIGAVIIAVMASLAAGIVSGRGSVPGAFNEARMRGALIAQDLVKMSNDSAVALADINKLDEGYKFEAALSETTQLIEKSREMRDKAAQLSKELETMTQSLPAIKSEDARQAAMEGITNRVSMISRYIEYTDYLEQLLDSLRIRFSGASGVKIKPVKTLIDEINSEIDAINNFDKEATVSMDRFDALVNGSKIK